MAKTDITAQRARDILNYDPETGTLRWKISNLGGTVRAGRIAGSFDREGYRRIRLDGSDYRGHRIAWLRFYGEWPAGILDHLNGVKSDNRITNLRLASNSENAQNRRFGNQNSASKLLGAHWNKTANCWQSGIKFGGKIHHLGLFATAEEAHEAYKAAKRRNHAFCSI